MIPKLIQHENQTLFALEDYSRFYEVGEFWTSGQRQANRIHEVSYRACFKPQLPKFFIEKFTEPGEIVYDPFAGRGTTAIEAALSSRLVISNDVNPISRILTEPRLHIPQLEELEKRLSKIPRVGEDLDSSDLGMFYQTETMAELMGLKLYLKSRKDAGLEDGLDRWIRMVATNRLTGHSPGFFSVYSLPPNQAVSRKSQVKINEKLGQSPSYRDTHALIMKKSKSLVSQLGWSERETLAVIGSQATFSSCDSASTPHIRSESVSLVVTSPPFLDVVQYAEDNWLRAWFNDLDAAGIAAQITMSKTVGEWSKKMLSVFSELNRVIAPGGIVAFEVGEIKGGKVNLEEAVIPLGIDSGFDLQQVLVNQQSFSKTSNIWGISNNKTGTNSNRIVVFRKK
jgi:hypothetical protein